MIASAGSASCPCSPVFGEFGERAFVYRECLVARRPTARGHQLLHVVASLVEPREPDAAFSMHMIEEFEDRLEPREAAPQIRKGEQALPPVDTRLYASKYRGVCYSAIDCEDHPKIEIGSVSTHQSAANRCS